VSGSPAIQETFLCRREGKEGLPPIFFKRKKKAVVGCPGTKKRASQRFALNRRQGEEVTALRRKGEGRGKG